MEAHCSDWLTAARAARGDSVPSLLIEVSADHAFALSGALILSEQGMVGDKAKDVLGSFTRPCLSGCRSCLSSLAQ